MAGLAVILTILFSSPDDSPTTIQSWAKADPGDFLTTAVTELNGTSEVATYGPPYNNTSGSAQKIGPISLQEAAGVKIPIDTAQNYVIEPLQEIPADPRLKARPRRLPGGASQASGSLDRRLRRSRCPRPASCAASRSCPPAATGRSRR